MPEPVQANTTLGPIDGQRAPQMDVPRVPGTVATIQGIIKPTIHTIQALETLRKQVANIDDGFGPHPHSITGLSDFVGRLRLTLGELGRLLTAVKNNNTLVTACTVDADVCSVLFSLRKQVEACVGQVQQIVDLFSSRLAADSRSLGAAGFREVRAALTGSFEEFTRLVGAHQGAVQKHMDDLRQHISRMGDRASTCGQISVEKKPEPRQPSAKLSPIAERTDKVVEEGGPKPGRDNGVYKKPSHPRSSACSDSSTNNVICQCDKNSSAKAAQARADGGIKAPTKTARTGTQGSSSLKSGERYYTCDALTGIDDAAVSRPDGALSCLFCGRKFAHEDETASRRLGAHLVREHAFGLCNLNCTFETRVDLLAHLTGFHGWTRNGDANIGRYLDLLFQVHKCRGHRATGRSPRILALEDGDRQPPRGSLQDKEETGLLNLLTLNQILRTAGLDVDMVPQPPAQGIHAALHHQPAPLDPSNNKLAHDLCHALLRLDRLSNEAAEREKKSSVGGGGGGAPPARKAVDVNDIVYHAACVQQDLAVADADELFRHEGLWSGEQYRIDEQIARHFPHSEAAERRAWRIKSGAQDIFVSKALRMVFDGAEAAKVVALSTKRGLAAGGGGGAAAGGGGGSGGAGGAKEGRDNSSSNNDNKHNSKNNSGSVGVDVGGGGGVAAPAAAATTTNGTSSTAPSTATTTPTSTATTTPTSAATTTPTSAATTTPTTRAKATTAATSASASSVTVTVTDAATNTSTTSTTTPKVPFRKIKPPSTPYRSFRDAVRMFGRVHMTLTGEQNYLHAMGFLISAADVILMQEPTMDARCMAEAGEPPLKVPLRTMNLVRLEEEMGQRPRHQPTPEQVEQMTPREKALLQRQRKVLERQRLQLESDPTAKRLRWLADPSLDAWFCGMLQASPSFRRLIRSGKAIPMPRRPSSRLAPKSPYKRDPTGKGKAKATPQTAQAAQSAQSAQTMQTAQANHTGHAQTDAKDGTKDKVSQQKQEENDAMLLPAPWTLLLLASAGTSDQDGHGGNTIRRKLPSGSAFLSQAKADHGSGVEASTDSDAEEPAVKSKSAKEPSVEARPQAPEPREKSKDEDEDASDDDEMSLDSEDLDDLIDDDDFMEAADPDPETDGEGVEENDSTEEE